MMGSLFSKICICVCACALRVRVRGRVSATAQIGELLISRPHVLQGLHHARLQSGNMLFTKLQKAFWWNSPQGSVCMLRACSMRAAAFISLRAVEGLLFDLLVRNPPIPNRMVNLLFETAWNDAVFIGKTRRLRRSLA